MKKGVTRNLTEPESKEKSAQVLEETFVCDSDTGVAVADEINSPKEASPKALVDGKVRPAENEPRLHSPIETESEDFWPTLNDDKGSIEESEHTESSQGTQNSQFLPHKLKTTMGKWAGKITEKFNSPPSTPYETLDDATELSKDKPEKLTHAQGKSSISAASSEERCTHKELRETLVEPKKVANEDTTKSKPSETTNEDPANALVQQGNSQDNEKYENVPLVKAHRCNESEDDEKKIHAEEPKPIEGKSPKESNRCMNRKKTRWRSATDATTGKTYYYMKGTQTVTWEKPSDL